MSSNVLVVYLLWLSFCRWKVVLKCIWVSYSSWNLFQNLEVNQTSLLVTIENSTPCRAMTSLMYTYANFTAEMLSQIQIKCVILVNWCRMTQIEPTPRAVRGKFVLKSMVISSHFQIWISNGCILSWGCWCLALIFLQVKHISTYQATSFFM